MDCMSVSRKVVQLAYLINVPVHVGYTCIYSVCYDPVKSGHLASEDTCLNPAPGAFGLEGSHCISVMRPGFVVTRKGSGGSKYAD